MSNKDSVASLLAVAHNNHIGQSDALLLMRAAVVLRKFCLQKQPEFNGSFSPDCLTAHVATEVRSFINVVLQGPPILEKDDKAVNLDARTEVASVISQVLIYNTCAGTHHDTATISIRRVKERETPFPLYHGLKLHAEGRQKKLIENANALGFSVSFNRVMEVKVAIARAVCKRHAEDGVVLPSNLRRGVFVTYDVDNLDSHSKGNFSWDEFHGTALSATNHLSWDNNGVARPPIRIDSSDTAVPQLPDSYVIVHLVDTYENHVIFAPKLQGRVRPTLNQVAAAKLKDEAWMAHVIALLEKGSDESTLQVSVSIKEWYLTQ